MAAFDRFHSIWGGELGSRILARADELGSALLEGVASHDARVERQETRAASLETKEPGESPLPPISSGDGSDGVEPAGEALATRDS